MDNNGRFFKLKNRDLVDLIISRDGGKTTINIIDKILTKPYNANQLAKILKLDYKTIIHHTNIMEDHEFITKNKFNKTYYIHPTDKLIKSLEEYYYIKKHLDDKH